ncbi:hypothetical protein PISMIDRAFT_613083 [Pisolithus microcarpus 441]|uniref:Uncharacterized protein n=1 Tax=Pisolithus microcarpus 441 TaxID=765257 RepID=A0A0D0A1I5_9AGAM|nr:hypothetical protein PISMIDRAFT_613083 [Pisolithus microcarpus 441]
MKVKPHIRTTIRIWERIHSGADPVIVRGRSLSGPATDSWNTPPKTSRFDTPVVLVGKPAGLIISVTLDCAAAQWIPTRFCECYGRDKRGARLTSLDPGLAKVETACPQGGETCPYYTAQQPFEPDDNTYAIPQSQGCCAVHISDYRRARKVIEKTASSKYRT